MTVEAATTIAQLNVLWPLFDDQIVEGDDHIRLLKQVMQNDAMSRSLGTAQTVVGPVTFNGLVTAKAGIRSESAQPVFEYRETDQALPLGLYRFVLATDIFALQKNTAVAGDFATSTSVWSYTPATGYLNLPLTKFTSIARLESAQPRLEMRESDVTLPGGLFRSMASAGNFHLQANTALAGDFATATDLLKFTGSTGRLAFGVPVDFTGGFSPGQSLEISGAAPSLLLTETDQTDPAGRYRWAGVGGNLQLQKALTVGWGTSEVLSEYDTALSSFRFNKLIRIDSTPAPSITFRQSDAAFPGGLFRIRVTSNGLRALCNTALAGDFSTEQSIWRYTGDGGVGVPGVFSFDVPVGSFKVRAVTPIITWEASGATPPAGQYRQYISGGDTFNFQRALTTDFATATTIWSYTGTSNIFYFASPVEFQNVVTITGANRLSVAYNTYVATDGGNLIVGSTTASGSSLVPSVNITGGVGNGSILVRRAGTANQTNVSFINNVAVTPATVGTISTNAAVTAYNTSSDETLKDIGGDYDPQDAIAIIRADPVLAWNWKADGTPGVGWVAQRSIEVSPDLASHIPPVVGAKDDEPLQEEWWGIDYGKRTPYLWAALAGALDRLDTIEARLAAYEGTPA